MKCMTCTVSIGINLSQFRLNIYVEIASTLLICGRELGTVPAEPAFQNSL